MFSAIRQRLRLRSVRARLTFWYVLTLGASLVVFAVFVWVVRARTLSLELDGSLEVRAHQLASDLRPTLLSLDVGAALAQHERARGAALIVREAPGAVLYEAAVFPELEWRDARRLAAAASEPRRLLSLTARGGAPMRVMSLQLERPGAAPLALQVAESTAPLRHILRQLAAAMVGGIMLVLGIAWYGSGITARRALAPVDAIVDRVRHLQATPGDRLDVHAGSAELDRLVATLNDMLDRIEGSMRSARRFAADASHELQTPLTAMRAIVDNCARCEGPAGSACELHGEIDRCSTLVRDLRLLALAEGGHIMSSHERVSLLTLTSECAEIARALAEARDVRVEARVADQPSVTGSALHLRRAVLNLLDNAIRYSPERSTVSLTVVRANGHALMTVRDQGCGIAEEDLVHVFEPFYRADPARARDSGGTGLGLAIADQIVRAHGGSIGVETAPGQGSTFTIVLPLAIDHSSQIPQG